MKLELKKVENILDLLGVEFALRPKEDQKLLKSYKEELEMQNNSKMV